MPTDDGYLYTHKPHMGTPIPVRLSELGPGDVIQFTYKGKLRWVFVLDPNYHQKLHGLDLQMVPERVLVNDVIGHMDVTDDPKLFYGLAVKKKVVMNCDGYRTYLITHIQLPKRMRYDLDEVEAADAQEAINRRPDSSLQDFK